MKVTMQEIVTFLREGWPGNDWYIEEEEKPQWWVSNFKEPSQGYEAINPSAIVDDRDISACVMYQGKGQDPTVSLEIPKEREAEISALLVSANAKIIGEAK